MAWIASVGASDLRHGVTFRRGPVGVRDIVRSGNPTTDQQAK
jgi:hypothetical protein